MSSFSYYMMTTTNKQYKYPRVTVIQIDVHPVGENPTNTPHTFHARSSYGLRPSIPHVVHIYQPFT
jgi:hypothetical protein